MIEKIKCPHCKQTMEACDAPDLYYFGEEDKDYQEQYNILCDMQKNGFNVMTCGFCGEIILSKE